MERSGTTGQRLAALFLLGCVAFNDPILSLFSRAPEGGSWPPLYAWVFGAWGGLVALVALAAERTRDGG